MLVLDVNVELVHNLFHQGVIRHVQPANHAVSEQSSEFTSENTSKPKSLCSRSFGMTLSELNKGG